MSNSAPRRTPSTERFALIAHAAADDIAAWRKGRRVTAAQLLADVMAAAEALPAKGRPLNLYADRYRFTVALLAATVRGQVTLLPPSATPAALQSMRKHAPDL